MQYYPIWFLVALADRVLDGTCEPGDFGFDRGNAGAGQIAVCLAIFNGYFDPTSTSPTTFYGPLRKSSAIESVHSSAAPAALAAAAPGSHVCALQGSKHAGRVLPCPTAASARSSRLPTLPASRSG